MAIFTAGLAAATGLAVWAGVESRYPEPQFKVGDALLTRTGAHPQECIVLAVVGKAESGRQWTYRIQIKSDGNESPLIVLADESSLGR